MSEYIRWESVIPNFQEGDVITPFGSNIQRMRDNDPGWDGGLPNHCGSIEELASVKRKSSQKVGVYAPNGVQILPEEFDECKVHIYKIPDFYGSGIRVKKQGLYGLYYSTGKMIVPPKYNWVEFEYNVIIVRIDKGEDSFYGVYSADGKEIIKCEYDYINYWGSIDRGDGYAIVRKNRLSGVISETGKQIIPCKFKCVRLREAYRYQGYIVTDATNLNGWYSRNGRFKIPCKFESFEFFNWFEDYLPATHIEVKTPEGLKGIYSFEGKEIAPPKFESFHHIGNYMVGLIGKDKLSVYDKDGVCVYQTAE